MHLPHMDSNLDRELHQGKATQDHKDYKNPVTEEALQQLPRTVEKKDQREIAWFDTMQVQELEPELV